MVSRRNFIKIAGAIPAGAGMRIDNHEMSGNTKPAKGAKIKSITLTAVTGNFVRYVGMNAYDTAPKGIKSGEELVRVLFDDGTEGLSVTGYSQIDDEVIAKMKMLIGKDPFSFYTWDGDRITGVTKEMQPYFFDTTYAWIEGAILDAIGKQKNLPVWKLFGNSVREGIDAYDGALYFEEIASGRDINIIGEVAKKIKNEGYKGIKIKLGRPAKWLPGEAGLHRDIEAFITLREAVGWNFNLMADANNGYKNNFDWAVKLLKSCAPYDMYWMEEIFPDDTPMYLKLREELMKDNFFCSHRRRRNINGQ
jgi:L-alanine-DL-glutamate epimerase-like enolase superfamily enzyme